jgi:hypothetical protein
MLFIVCAVFALGMRGAAGNDLPSHNPYKEIPRHNPFRLLAPVALLPPVEKKPAETQTIRLAGISSVGGTTIALLEVRSANDPLIHRPILQEKEKFADIEVVSIDPEHGTISVRIDAKTKNLCVSPAVSVK